MSTQQFNRAMSDFMDPSCEEPKRVPLLKTLMAEAQDATDRDEVIRAAASMMDDLNSDYDKIRSQLLSEPIWKSAVLKFCPNEGEYDELRSWFYCLQEFEKQELLTVRDEIYRIMDICIANTRLPSDVIVKNLLTDNLGARDSLSYDFSDAVYVMIELAEPLATRKAVLYLADGVYPQGFSFDQLFRLEDVVFEMFDEDPEKFLTSSLLGFFCTLFDSGSPPPKDSRLAKRAAEFMEDLRDEVCQNEMLVMFIPSLGLTAKVMLPVLRSLEARLEAERRLSSGDVDTGDFEENDPNLDEESHLVITRSLIRTLS